MSFPGLLLLRLLSPLPLLLARCTAAPHSLLLLPMKMKMMMKCLTKMP